MIPPDWTILLAGLPGPGPRRNPDRGRGETPNLIMHDGGKLLLDRGIATSFISWISWEKENFAYAITVC